MEPAKCLDRKTTPFLSPPGLDLFVQEVQNRGYNRGEEPTERGVEEYGGLLYQNKVIPTNEHGFQDIAKVLEAIWGTIAQRRNYP